MHMKKLAGVTLAAAACAATLTGCNSARTAQGYLSGQDDRITEYFTVSPSTGFCYSNIGHPNYSYYTRTWVPCTDKVVEQLPENLRPLADRKAGLTMATSQPN